MFASPFADIKSPYKESHLVLDFTVGRDVGLGMFGGSSSSVLSAGVRYAQFSQSSTVQITGRPTGVVTKYQLGKFITFNQNMLSGQSDRNFHGIGPSLSWQASAAVLGNDETGELTVDWGINGSLLFGRQKAATNHTTSAYNDHARLNRGRGFTMLYGPYTHHSTRSKGVTVPNVGGFAGLSVKYPNAKLSLGYRADFFFGAVDAGIDTRDAKELGFHGPFAAISVGLGG
jgi:hypothetical protein